MASRSPEERVLIARINAHKSWSRTEDRSARTAAARQAANVDRFEKQVDPDGVLPPAERARRAEHARKAWLTELALRSARSRRRAAEARTTAEQLDQAAKEAESDLDSAEAER